MKNFAITPNNITLHEVVNQLPDLKHRQVSFLYIRSSLLFNKFIEPLARYANSAGILPLIPYKKHNSCKGIPYGIHFKSHETDLLKTCSEASHSFISAACHDLLTAEKILEESVDYAFVSPVFNPLSKPGDQRQLLSRSRLKALVATYGERVVLLGGLTEERIQMLRDDFGADFSVAGITMFFGEQK